MRLFYGLSLPSDIRASVASLGRSCEEIIPGRYVPKANYHITLAFLGDVPENRLDEAKSILSACIKSCPAPLLKLQETSFFGKAQNAILIARVHSAPALDPLHAALISRLDQANLPYDSGPFAPHITLARHARLEGVCLPAPTPLSFAPTHAHLYLSARNEENVLTYTPIFSIPFIDPAF